MGLSRVVGLKRLVFFFGGGGGDGGWGGVAASGSSSLGKKGVGLRVMDCRGSSEGELWALNLKGTLEGLSKGAVRRKLQGVLVLRIT